MFAFLILNGNIKLAVNMDAHVRMKSKNQYKLIIA